MPTTIDATVGGSSANSYVTLAEANTYHDDRLHNAEWAAASDDDKTRALLWAAQEIDKLRYSGYIAASTQALRFPRTSVYDWDGRLLDSATIPIAVKDAQCRMALHLLRADTTLQESDDIDALKVGPISIEFNKSGISGTAMPDDVRSILQAFLSPFGTLEVIRA